MILLLGATGYMGQAFATELRKRDIPFTPLTRKAVDYTRFDLIFDYIHKLKPDFVINAAGCAGHPDTGCEAMRAEAVQANTLLPQTIARVCYLNKISWGHISSGGIYSGAKMENDHGLKIERNLNSKDLRQLFDLHPEKFRGFTEADEPNCSFRSPPCSFYSGTKALAEEALRWFNQCYIWRPQIIFDEFDHPRNYLSKIQNHSEVPAGVNSFSHRGDFVQACLQILERRSPFGTYNIVNSGAATKQQIIAAMQHNLRLERKFELANDSTKVGKKEDDASSNQSLLDATKLLSTGIKIRSLQEALEDSLKKWQPFPQDGEWPGPSQRISAQKQS